MSEEMKNGALDWNDTIETDDQEYVIIPEGEYFFTVKSFERGRYKGGEKIPACSEAVLKLEITTNDGPVTIMDRLKLHKSMEWKLSQFFRAIGQKKHGEKLVMDWTKVPGATGRVKLKPRKYKKDDGTEGTTNNIDKYLDYDADKMMIADEPVEGDLPWGDEA